MPEGKQFKAFPEPMAQDNREFDLIQLITEVVQRWKSICVIIAIGTIISLAFAITRTHVFEASIELSKPSQADIVELNENGFSEFTPEQVFQRVYENARSLSVFSEFVDKQGYLSKLKLGKSQQELEQNKSIYLAEIIDSFDDKILKSTNRTEERSYLDANEGVMLLFYNKSEALAVEMLNEYVEFVGEKVLQEIAREERILIDSKLNSINRRIEQSRLAAKREREIQIQRLEQENEEKLRALEQQRNLLIALAKQNRITKIAQIEEENQIKLQELEQERELLITKAKLDREKNVSLRLERNEIEIKKLQQKKQLLLEKTRRDKESRIAVVKEALKIAQSLQITYPTTLEEFQPERSKANTEIFLNSSQELPLYMMGTKYLSTLIKTLEERENEAVLITELNDIEMQIDTLIADQEILALQNRESDEAFLLALNDVDMRISQIKNDKRLKQLIDRESDEKYLSQLNEIDNEIAKVKNDTTLAMLRNRTSDDAYIDDLADNLNEIANLSDMSVDFSNASVLTVNRAPMETGIPVRPNRKLIVLFGVLASSFFAILIALVSSIFVIVRGKRRAAINQ